jgi:hypothetical protein
MLMVVGGEPAQLPLKIRQTAPEVEDRFAAVPGEADHLHPVAL